MVSIQADTPQELVQLVFSIVGACIDETPEPVFENVPGYGSDADEPGRQTFAPDVEGDDVPSQIQQLVEMAKNAQQ